MNAPSSRPRFTVGQVWKYWARPGEEDSRAIVGRVEKDEEGNVIVHVKLVGVRLIDPGAPRGFWPELSHAPVAEDAFAESVTELTSEAPDLTGHDEGYRTWRENRGGVFMVSLADVLHFTEEALG
jgi:hypothetical protein